MYTGMYSTAAALETSERNHEVIAINLANINTSGYKSQTATFQAMLPDQSAANGTNARGTGLAPSKFDFSMGQIEATGRNLDVAIEGDGFFELSTEQGPLFTRNGVFFIGPDGSIVNATGLPVAGESGPLQVADGMTPDQIKISADGTVSAGEIEVGKLKIVSFDDPQKLELRGRVLFELGKAIPGESTSVVRQGKREQSNVNATQQLVKLIVGMRHHETAQKALKSMSDSMSQRLRPN